MSREISRVAIVGGTHGNEKGGVLVVDNFCRNPARFQFPNLEVHALLANPEAELRNVRYLDRDLNRCFGPELAQARKDHAQRERVRALAIQEQLAPNGVPAFDLVVDLHNTTSNMGITWILTSNDPWVWWLAAQAKLANPSVVDVLYTPEDRASNVFLPSLGKHEITIEIGPVPHGTLSHKAWQQAESTTLDILQKLSEVPDDFSPGAWLAKQDFPYYWGMPSHDYPRDEHGKILGILHDCRVNQDYQPLRSGDPLFVIPSTGEVRTWDGPEVYPVFTGEAAYVEKGIAFTPTNRCSFNGGEGVLN